MLPIHLAAREGHGIGVIDALLESFPGGASERDGNGAFSIDLALDYACQNAKRKKRREGSATSTKADGVEDEVDDPRWAVVEHILLESPEAAVDSSSAELSLQREGKKTVLLLGALSKSAPESVVRMLIPPAAPYFSSRYGANDASTALYVAIANRYPLDIIDQIVSICPVQTRSVRDETGMGLVAASYVVWAYGDGGGKKKDPKDGVGDKRSRNHLHWTRLRRHDDMMKSLIEAQESVSLEGPLSPPTKGSTEKAALPEGFHDWWNKMKYWIQYYRPATEGSGALLPTSVDAFPEHLLHAALANPDAPPSVIFILLRLDIASAASQSVANDRLPIHAAAVTLPYTARHYEENQMLHSTMELVYRAHPAAVRVRDPVTNRLPLHLALWNGQKTWNQGIAILAQAEARALNVKDWSSHHQNKRNEGSDEDQRAGSDVPTGLYPFQMAAVARPPTEEMKLRFAYQARNRFSSAQWRGMTVRQKAAEAKKEEVSHDMDVLTTVFELLRSEPAAISDKRGDGGSVVKLLAMRWGAKSSKLASTGTKSPNYQMKTSDRNKSEETSLFPSSATPTIPMQDDGDPFGNLYRASSDFSEDSFGFKTSNASALQFNVNSLGQGTVTEMPSDAAFDVSASIQEEHCGLTQHAGGNANNPVSPSTADEATPTGTALLSPEWFGNTAILSPQSQELVNGYTYTTASSTDTVPQGFVDPHLTAIGEGKTLKKKSPWFKVRSFNKSRRSAVGNDESNTSDVPHEFDVADDYFSSPFSPEKTPRDEAQVELMILASRLKRGAIYNDWMKGYNVDRAEEEESRAFDALTLTDNTMARSRLDTGVSSVADASSREMSRDNDVTSSMLCVACSSSQKEMLCLPCRHLCLCSGCAKRNKMRGCCPICNRSVSSTVEVFY